MDAFHREAAIAADLVVAPTASVLADLAHQRARRTRAAEQEIRGTTKM